MVAIGGEQSSIVDVVSGVPLDSVLGPLCFIIYTDDVTSKVSPTSTISLFADDIRSPIPMHPLTSRLYSASI